MVEVRARLDPGAIAAVEETRVWLAGVPDHFSVLLIVPLQPTPTKQHRLATTQARMSVS
jgi:hypothetical protein